MSTFAQNITVKGVVKDASGETVIGASVLQKGTLNGVVTDAAGAYQLSVPGNATLQISSIGYKTVDVAVNNRTTIDVTLEDDNEMLEETVVIGYGTAKKSDVTGSIASVNQEVLRQVPAGDISTALAGRVAGMEMRSTSSTPGASMRIRIRGTRSLSASNDPLIVLDGIPYSGSLNDINVEDVKSIDVLKDASSTAIYGSRGANGVIMVTTEHGQQEAPARVNFSSSASYKQWIPIPYMNTEELMALRDMAGKYGYTTDELATNDTDWQAEYYEPGYQIRNNLTITGGIKGGNYSFGASYYKDESNVPTEGFDRVTVRASLDKMFGKYVKFGFATNMGTNQNYGQNAGAAEVDLTPMISAYDEDGNTRREALLMPKDQNYVAKTRALMYEIADVNVDESKRYFAYNNAYLELEAPFLKGLKYRLNAGYNIRMSESGSYLGEGILSPVPDDPATASRSWGLSKNWTLENLLTFNRTINDVHNISATAMYSAESSEYYYNTFSSRDVPADYMLYYYMGDGAGTLTFDPGDQTYTNYGLTSLMARLMYTYNNKYMISATVRSDASSRLATGHQRHTYPAISAGWNIHNEDFMDNVNWIDMLKFRAGFGQTSNQSISPYSTLGELSTTYYNYGSDFVTGYYVSSLPNTDLGWEYSETYNAGLDFGLFDGRLTGNIEYYIVNTHDLLMNVSLPSTAGVTSYSANIGKTRNNGFEVALNGTIIKNSGDGFNWNAGLNFYHNHNEIVELASGQTEDRSNNWYVGYPVNSFRDYVYEGIWQEGEEEALYIREGSSANVGMIKVKYFGDYDENGLPTRQTNDDDKVIQSYEADLNGGFTSTMTWKGFDFTVIGSFQVGGIYYSDLHAGYSNGLCGRRNNVKVDYWTPTNTDAHWPKPGGVSEDDDCARYRKTAARFSGTNVFLSTITLGYTFAKFKNAAAGIRNLRVYTTVQNPCYIYSPFQKMTGLRPSGNDGAFTIDNGTPQTINYLLGFNISF